MKNGKTGARALVLYNIDPVREARLKRGKLMGEGAELPRMYPDTLLDAITRAGFNGSTATAYENPTYEGRFLLRGHGYGIVIADINHLQNGELKELRDKLQKASWETREKRIPVLLIGEEFSAAVRAEGTFKRFMSTERGLDAIAARAYDIATREHS